MSSYLILFLSSEDKRIGTLKVEAEKSELAILDAARQLNGIDAHTQVMGALTKADVEALLEQF